VLVCYWIRFRTARRLLAHRSFVTGSGPSCGSLVEKIISRHGTTALQWLEASPPCPRLDGCAKLCTVPLCGDTSRTYLGFWTHLHVLRCCQIVATILTYPLIRAKAGGCRQCSLAFQVFGFTARTLSYLPINAHVLKKVAPK